MDKPGGRVDSAEAGVDDRRATVDESRRTVHEWPPIVDELDRARHYM